MAYGPVGLSVQYRETAADEPMAGRIVLVLAGSTRRVRIDQPHGGDFDWDVVHEDDAAPGDPRWSTLPDPS